MLISREEIFFYTKETYGIEPDYPWKKSPNSAVLRHTGSRKWFGLIMEVPCAHLDLDKAGAADILNVKCDPILIGSLRNEEGILPAYHMNKEYWISILLNSSFPKENVCSLLDFSYKLTK